MTALPAFLPELPLEVPVAAAVALLVLVALVLGEVATRLRVPRLLGYVLAGVGFALLGDAVGLPDVPAFGVLGTTAEVAAALILFDLGQRVSFAWLVRNPWLALASALECALTFGLVFWALRALEVAPLIAALASSVAIATSPAIVLAVTREVRAQGQVTERALLLTALNCIVAVVVCTLLMAWALVERHAVFEEFVLHPLYLVFGSLLLASVMARLLLLLARLVGREKYVQWLVVVAMVSLVVALAPLVKVSSLLALLSLGAFARGFDAGRHLNAIDLRPLSAAAIVLVITLSAAAVSHTTVSLAWAPALALVLARIVAKTTSLTALARASGLGWRKGAYVGLALTPMAAMAPLLVSQLALVSVSVAQQVQAVVLPAALVMSVLGTLVLMWALQRSGESTERSTKASP